MNSKKTKGALFSSVIALVLCFSMLLGTTFAWFTDSVTSTNNIIKAGNLDVELEYAVLENGSIKEWKPVKADTELFDPNALWEPGYTQVVYLRVANKGTLALKYQLGINIESETGGINVENNPFKLSDSIRMGVVEDQTTVFADRDAAVAAVPNSGIISTGYTKSGEMRAGAEDIYLALVVYMPETVKNEANYKTGTTAPQIALGINLFATQLQAEYDSFGNDYDKDATWTGSIKTHWYYDAPAGTTAFTLTTAEDLAGLAEIVNSGVDTFKGKTVTLTADVDLNNVNWTPIGTGSNKFEGTFIGTGYTISNLRVVGEKALGLFGKTFTGAHIEGVTIENAYVSGNDYVGAILGQGYLGHNCIVKCKVTGATIIATPYLLADGTTYDGGAKAGVIAGQAYNGDITGCTVENSSVTAYRDLGGIAGMHDFDGKAGNSVTASGNTVKDVTLTYIGVAGAYDGDKSNQNMNAVIGRVGTNAEVGENTVTNVTMNEDNAGAVMIFTLDELIGFANAVNGGETYKGKTVILGANIDLNNMEWTPIGNSTSKFQGTFDGNGHTISNLKITGYNNDVGLFGVTTDGEIKNLIVENANVSGRLNVGVVAGTPYTSKYTNITVTGHVEVNGMSYVGGVGGKNAYADWTSITVNADETSYVKATSTENGTAYRSYVGGVVGFNGEGSYTFKNITSNIDVIGDVCDIGGVFGIAHYGNNFENITCTGNVTNLVSTENDGDDAAADALETGLIAGVWHNGGSDVTFTNISATGIISTPNVDTVGEFPNKGLIGQAYNASGTGKLIINNVEVIATAASLQAALDAATGTSTITLAGNINGDVTATEKDGVNIIIEGNGYTYNGVITVDGNSARNTGSLTIQNVNFNAESLSADAYINLGKSGDNNTRYTDNVTVKNCTFFGNGFAAVKSYTGGDKNLIVDGCTVNAGMHSMLQATNVEEGLTITGCKVYSKNGINLNSTPSLTMSGCEFNVQGYAVRFGVNGATLNGEFKISNSTLTSANVDGDAVIIFRGTVSGSTLALINTTLNGDPEISGEAKIIYAEQNEDGAFVAKDAATLRDVLDLGGDVIATGTVDPEESIVVSEWGSSAMELYVDAGKVNTLNGGTYVLDESTKYGVVVAAVDEQSVTLSDMSITADSRWSVTLDNYGNDIVLKNVSINAKSGAGIWAYGSDSVTTLNNVTVTQVGLSEANANTAWANTAVAVSNGQTLVINGGTYIGQTWAVYGYNSGSNVTINGGTFKAERVIQMDGVWNGSNTSVATINGGNFEGAIYLDWGTNVPEIYINGGTFTKFSATVCGQAKLVITGGTFDADPSAYVANGYTATESNGVWIVAAN